MQAARPPAIAYDKHYPTGTSTAPTACDMLSWDGILRGSISPSHAASIRGTPQRMQHEYEAYGHGRPIDPVGSQAEPESARLWEALARAAYEISEEARPVPPVDGRLLAEIIAARAPDAAYYRSLAAPLAEMASAMTHEPAAAVDVARRRLSGLSAGVGLDAMRSIVAASGEPTQKRAFLLDAAQTYPIDALLRLLVAGAPEAGQELSRPLVRLLYKMAVQTRTGPASLQAAAEAGLREEVARLASGWWLVQSGAMAFGFDEMFQPQPQAHDPATTPDPDRMVFMALEVDAVGGAIWAPVTRMLGDGRFGELLAVMRAAPRESRAARAIAQHLATPQRLSLLLAEREVDFDSVDRLLEHMGVQAAPALMDRMATADSRATRRGIFDRLVAFGTTIGPAAFERLNDPRWFVQRNILALLAELEWWPDEASIMDFIRHSDPRVRKEAIRTLLRVPRHRERVLAAALRDETDRQTLRMVLTAAREDCPDTLIPMVVRRVGDDKLAPDLRVAAVDALGSSRSTQALEALLRIASTGTNLFGRPKLATKSSESIAALRALAAGWQDEPRARGILQAASRSRDRDVADAAADSGS